MIVVRTKQQARDSRPSYEAESVHASKRHCVRSTQLRLKKSRSGKKKSGRTGLSLKKKKPQKAGRMSTFTGSFQENWLVQDAQTKIDIKYLFTLGH